MHLFHKGEVFCQEKVHANVHFRRDFVRSLKQKIKIARRPAEKVSSSKIKKESQSIASAIGNSGECYKP